MKSPIIFLNAFPMNETMWNDQVEGLSGKFQTITFDWRNLTSMESMADDINNQLNTLSIDRATICGLSMGGYAALAFYRKYSERVHSLILSDTRATEDTDDVRKRRFEMMDIARQKGSTAIADIMMPGLLSEMTFQSNPKIVKRVRAIIESAHPELIVSALRAMADRKDSTDLLPHISCPTLVIVGAEDKMTTPMEAEQIYAAIPGAKLEIIPNAGHLSNIEQPGLFNKAVSRYQFPVASF